MENKRDVAISVEGLKKFALDGTPLLKGISFEIGKGEFVIIYGPPGSGKTMLINLLQGANLPDEGTINVLGFDLSRLKPTKLHKLTRRIGVVPQKPSFLWDRNVEDNLKFVWEVVECKGRDKEEKVRKSLERVKLLNKRKNYAFELSSQEKKLLLLGMAIIKDPDIYLLDDPILGLDKRMGVLILTIIEEENREGKTVVFATADIDFFKDKGYRIIKLL